MQNDTGYNERLFSGGVRAWYHLARFRWLRHCIDRLQCRYDSVLELGCFDGKTLDYLPHKPIRYVGLDANWEGGLDLARMKWGQEINYAFRQCATPAEARLDSEHFDISICMETLEHLSPGVEEAYLKMLANVTTGYIFMTIPNEIGFIFLCKYLVKRLFGSVPQYTFWECCYETLGQTERVHRNEHKGFHYRACLRDIAKYVDILEVSGHPLLQLPPALNFGIGIIGTSRLMSHDNIPKE